MLLIFGHILFMSLRWLYQKIRYERYARAIHGMLKNSGLFIERWTSEQKSNLKAMELLNSSSSFKGLSETLFQDNFLKIHQLQSMVEIDLSNWIAYKVKPKFVDEVKVLVELRASSEKGAEALEDVQVKKLHVLTCGTPLAWRVEDPQGILLACDLSGLVTLVDALGQNDVIVDKGFEVTGLATVKTKNLPKHLISKEEDVRNISSVLHEDPPSEARDKLNLGAFKAMTLQNSPPKDMRDGVMGRKFSVDVQKADGISSKPPNVLIYCGVKDSARKFSEAEASLSSCVNTDAYAVYHLTHDSLMSSPWERNTAALVITACAHLRSDAEEKIYNFVTNFKGNLISFNSSIDKRFSLQTKSNSTKSERLIAFSFKDWKSISSVSGPNMYSGIGDEVEIVIPVESLQENVPGTELELQDGADSSKASDHRRDTSDKVSSPRSESQSSNSEALIVKVSPSGGGTVILSQLLLERDPTSFAIDDKSFTVLKKSNTERLGVLKDLLGCLGIDTNPGPIPSLTCCHLVAMRKGLRESFLGSFRHRLNSDQVLKSKVMSLKFDACIDEEDIQSNLLPVYTQSNSAVETQFFDLQTYWNNLQTKTLGQIVFYTDVISSTMSVFDSLLFSIPNGMSPVAIAGRQTSGRGRGGNAWLSPVGCAMFTLPMKLSLDSELGSHISFLQHLVAVSVLQSVVTLPGYETINIRLKWPNDIYFGRDIKLGGVLVKSTLMDNIIYATIGCGFNVSNSNPTMCINDIIQQHNSSNPDQPPLQPLSPGQLLGRSLTILESLVDDFQKNGWNNFCQLYYKYWLHGGKKVKIDLDTKTEGVIVGLDKYGFLSLRTEDGKLISVQPDGNSFDMLHNLIHFKTQ